MSQYVVSSSGREIQKTIVRESGIALDGMPIFADLFIADGEWSVDEIKVGYTAVAAIPGGLTRGTNVVLGTYTQQTKFVTWNSLTSATLGQVVSLSLNKDKRVLSNNEMLTLRTFGTLANAGMISVYVYLSRLR